MIEYFIGMVVCWIGVVALATLSRNGLIHEWNQKGHSIICGIGTVLSFVPLINFILSLFIFAALVVILLSVGFTMYIHKLSARDAFERVFK